MIITYIPLNKKKQCFECFSFYFQSNWSARMDFLATYAAVNLDGALISKEITGIMGCQVGLSKDLYGSDLQAKSTSGTTTSISMTLLLKHTVAHSTRPSFRRKTNNQPPAP